MSFTDERRSRLLPAVHRIIRKANARAARGAGVGHWLPANELVARAELEQVRLFVGADLNVVARLLYGCALRKLAPAQMLVSPIVPLPAMYLVLSGELRSQRVGDGDQPPCLLGPGDSVGELGVIDRLPEPLYVVARQTTRVLVIDRETLWELVRQSHAIARNMLAATVGRVRRINRAIATVPPKVSQPRALPRHPGPRPAAPQPPSDSHVASDAHPPG